ncbi:cell division control protein 48 C-like, partial [Trifolium medium]|nr:cell division control protein 48 C-like [Trifolium medium]
VEEDRLQKKEETTLHNKSSMSCDSVLASGSEFNNGGENVMNDVNVRKDGPRFKDLGGMEKVIEELKNTILKPFFNPKVCQVLGVKPINGLLLHGLPGCGKTKLAHAIAYETGFNFYPTSATQLVSGIS